ncbi:MAG: cyclic nucleotide-binding domain-containing protein [Chrysiogenetes bacterium]|nr:cyclic nucleotide-binding domain-containing protein [Chrysiogenetes bacterium]
MAAVNKVKLKAEATKFFQKGKYEKAIETYRTLVKADKRDDRSMIRIAECYRKLKKNKEAIAAYRQVATFYANAGFLIKAIAINKQILDIDPNNSDVQAELADLYAKRGIPAGGGGGAHTAPEVAAAAAEVESALEEAEDEEVISEADEIAAAEAAEAVTLDLDEDVPDMASLSTEAEGLPDLNAAPAAEAPPPPPPPAAPSAAARNLPTIPLFSDLQPDEFAFVIDTCQVKSVGPRTRIIEEGEMGNSMFVLVSGEVLIYRHDEAGNTIKITTLKEGSFFGEFALLSDSKRHASVGALTDCELLEITREHLDEIVAKFPRVGEVMNEFYKKRILATLLLTSPLFQPLSIEDRKQLVTKFQMMTKKPSEDVLVEGGPGDGLYLIKSGEVEIIIHDKEGNEVTITYLSEGSFFGEISLIEHKPCTATVRTTQDTILLKLPKDAFNEVIMTHPQVLELITEYVEERQRETTETRSSVNSLSEMGMV